MKFIFKWDLAKLRCNLLSWVFQDIVYVDYSVTYLWYLPLLLLLLLLLMLLLLLLFINCNWVITRWLWLFYMYTKYEIGY